MSIPARRRSRAIGDVTKVRERQNIPCDRTQSLGIEEKRGGEPQIPRWQSRCLASRMDCFRQATGLFSCILIASGFPGGKAAAGNFTTTGVETDLAIVGDGYCLVRAGTERLLTRHLRLRIDHEGRFLTTDGHFLIGYPASINEPRDMKLGIATVTRDPTATINGFQIRTNGEIAISFSSGETLPSGRIPLWLPPDPTALKPVGDTEFSDPALAGDWEALLCEAGHGDAGWIQAGGYETPTPLIQLKRFDRTKPSFATGPLMQTGIQTHLALDGPGFLEVRDPVTGEAFLTRCGALKLDANGYLIYFERGLRVQGWLGTAKIGNDTYQPTSMGDIMINMGVPPPELNPLPDPYACMSSYSIDELGTIRVRLSDGSEYFRGRIGMVVVANPDQLVPAGDQLYAKPSDEPLPAPSNEASIHTRLRPGKLDLNLLDSAVLEVWRKQAVGLQGALHRTGHPDLLAISGHGFFMLREPGTNREVLTRLGIFHWTDEGFLAAAGGWRVQGRMLESDVFGDIRLESSPGHSPANRDINLEGFITVRLPDGSQIVPAQIWLMAVPDLTIMREINPFQYELPPEAAGFVRYRLAPGGCWTGRIQAGAIEALWEVTAAVPDLVPLRGMAISAWGRAGRPATVEWTDDLSQWSERRPPLSFDPQIRATGQWTIPDEVASTARFYRLVVQGESVPDFASELSP